MKQKKAFKWLILVILLLIFVAGTKGYLENQINFLEQEELALKMGDHHLTLYDITKGLLAIITTFWVAGIIIDIIGHRIRNVKEMRSTSRNLTIKLSQILVYFLAFLVSMDVLGIDLTALTVFSGALGIGLGFGLQKIASNFMSGLILLFEKSIEEDDLIELNDGTFGFIRQTGARFTLIETFDSKEIMIPNEDFITNRVTNWTYTNKQGRVEVSVGISYDADTRLAQKLMTDAAAENNRCSKAPAPVCYVKEFGDNSVNLLMYFWVDDVTQGRYLPKSEVILSIQDKFREHKINIPFPQRDLYIKNPEQLK
jgi:small-conductance mechanosensitive channel